jgi:hypothetical protein
MANVSRVNGLRPVQYDDRKVLRCYHASGTATTADLYVGDPVTIGGTADADGVPSVAIATAGDTNPILGVVVGVECDPNHLDRTTWIEGTTAGYVMVLVDPDAVYEAQIDEAVAVTYVGCNFNLVVTTAPGTTTTQVSGCSGWSVDATGATTTATFQVKCIGFPRRPDNEVGAVYNKGLFIINNSLMKGGTGSVGV